MKEFEDDDPMELQAMMMPGVDPKAQATFIIEEFLSMGMPKNRVLDLFKDPFYMGTFRLYEMLGEGKVAALIQESQVGVLNIKRMD